MKAVILLCAVWYPANTGPGGARAGNNGADSIAHLVKQLELKPGNITASPIPGLYRITLGSRGAYVSADGCYLLRGDLIDLHNGENLTSRRLAAARLAYLANISPADMIVFPAHHPVRSITVLTDIDCHYCRVLEQKRPALNALGISVRYLAFPAGGIGSVAWQQALDVWCAKDRQTVFVSAMQGKVPNRAQCAGAAVRAGHRFGQWLGLDGTPVIITDQSALIDGYLPATTLARLLGVNVDKSATRH